MDDRYEVVMGSDTQVGGMFLELWDRSTNRLALWAFYLDSDGSFEFTNYMDVPPEVDAWFKQEAQRRLPPMT